MTTFVFETITAAQALSYSSASDALVFTNPTSTGSKMTVLFTAVPGTATVPATTSVTLTDNADGKTVVFGAGILGETGITFPDGSQLIVGTSSGDATLTGGALGDGIFGFDGNDTIDGGAGNDVLQGNAGNDNITAGAGNDTVFGGQGDDTIDVTAGVNFAQGNKGNDTITAAASTSSNTILGGQNDDSIIGGAGSDFLNGNLGNDTIASGGGSDTILVKTATTTSPRRTLPLRRA